MEISCVALQLEMPVQNKKNILSIMHLRSSGYLRTYALCTANICRVSHIRLHV